MTDLSKLPSQSCKNCHTVYQGYFCPNCGQKHITERFSLKEGISHVFSMIFNFDRGLWPTIYNLIRRPGKVIHDYLNGITVPYFHPFRFLFLMVTVQVLVMVTTGIYDYVQDSYSQQTMAEGTKMPEFYHEMMAAINSYMNLMIAASMPILAFGSWLLFKNKGYNYAEHLIIVSYAYGMVSVVTMLFIPVYYVDKELYSDLNFYVLLISLALFTYVYVSFFKGKTINTIFKAIGAFVVWFFGFTMLIAIISISMVYYKVKSDPNFKESIKNEMKQP